VGDPCTRTSQCTSVPTSSPVTCLREISYGSESTPFPGGYCSAACGESSDCGSGADCVGWGPYLWCFKLCDSPDLCRVSEGYTCGILPDSPLARYCIPM
jgi:hypothetical protein